VRSSPRMAVPSFSGGGFLVKPKVGPLDADERQLPSARAACRHGREPLGGPRREGWDVDSGDKLDLIVDAKRPAIQPKPAFLNFPAQETR
jgi:hypothetical protein